MKKNTAKKWIRNESDKAAIKLGCYFDTAIANKHIKFIETYLAPSFGILKDQGKKFKLFPYQKDLISRFYGWRNKDSSKRFKRVYFSCSRQNFKSYLGQILSTSELMLNQNAPNIAWFSCKLEESEPAFDQLSNFIRRSKDIDECCVITPSDFRIEVPAHNGKFKLLTSNPTRGQSYTLTIIDEFAFQKNDSVYEAVEFSGRARSDSTLVLITTAGKDRTTECYAQYNYAKKIISNEIVDHTYLAEIWEAEETDSIFDEQTWFKANPSMPHGSINMDLFKSDLEKARYSKNAETRFKNLSLNIWTQNDETYLNLDRFEECGIKQIPDFTNQPCYLGLDFASKGDILAATWWILKDNLYYIFTKGWVSKHACDNRAKKNWTRYEKFIEEGSLELCPGDTTDPRLVRQFIDQLNKTNPIKTIAFDETQAKETALILSDQGYKLLAIPQGALAYTSPLRKLDQLVSDKLLRYDANKKFLFWQTQNLQVKETGRELITPTKALDTEKIDSWQAGLMALIPLVDQTTIAKKPNTFKKFVFF